jgi:wobble nucleotide-excising tRNase
MAVQCFKLVRNTGRFSSFAAGTAANLRHKKLTLVYGENGIGKTTLTAILRALASGSAVPIQERRRLGVAQAPHVVVEIENTADAVFMNGAWSSTYPDMLVFDDTFVNENVHSGLSVLATQRQNLHGFILGRDGVRLVQQLDGLTENIASLHADLRTKGDAIGPALRGTLSIDEFCGLPPIPDVDEMLAEAKRTLEAQEQANAVQTTAAFETFGLPLTDLSAVQEVLRRELSGLEATALQSVQQHFATQGAASERWISEGMRLLGTGSQCPFCAQDVAGSALVNHFRAYFAQAYRDHKDAIGAQRTRIVAGFHGDALAAFQRRLVTATERQRFWGRFVNAPAIDLDTDEIARVWSGVRTALTGVLDRKTASPLEIHELTDAERAAVDAYEVVATKVAASSRGLAAVNPDVQRVKTNTARGNLVTARADVSRLQATQRRHAPATSQLCAEYLAAKTAKEAGEVEKGRVRDELDRYRDRVLPTYEAAINERLRRFNADFRIVEVQATDPRGVPSSTYCLQINDTRVQVGGAETPGDPAFRNTLSSGDRNTLALAFFFARLDSEPNLARTVVVVDDPITSLDDARSVVTAQEVRSLLPRTKQVIVLSHSKPLLCSIWEHTDQAQCAPLQVRRTPDSTIQPWDVNNAAITEYDRRHRLLRDYIAGIVAPADVRRVAEALRPVVEGYLRVSCPEHCPPGTLLGPFINTARNANPRLVSDAVLDELANIKEYANRFHHDTNPDWDREVENINEGQLRGFTERVLAIVRVR